MVDHINDLTVSDERGPKYKKLSSLIAKRISSGQYNGKIPSCSQLAQQYSMNIKTVNKAVSALVERGLLEKKRGLGTFVATSHPARHCALGVVGNPSKQEFFAREYASGVFSGISKVASAQGGIVSYQEKPWETPFTALFRNNLLIDGMLIYNPLPQQEEELLASKSSLPPFVIIGDTPQEEDLNYVDTDNIGDSATGMEMLIDRGHKSILLAGRNKELIHMQNRQKGYELALRKAGLVPDEQLQFWFGKEGFTSEQRGKLLALANSQDKPTAIFGANHAFALELIRLLDSKGQRHYANSLDLLVYDDDFDDLSCLGRPYLVIQQPLIAIGSTAAEQLFKLIRGAVNKVGINLQSSIIEKTPSGNHKPERKIILERKKVSPSMSENKRKTAHLEGANPWPTLPGRPESGSGAGGQAFGAVRIGYFAEVYVI